MLPLYNKAVQVGRTVINFSVKAQHSGSNAHGQEGSAMKSYKEKNKDQHVKTGFAILNDMLPIASPEFNPLENENQ